MAFVVEPLFFSPVFKEKIWGGKTIKARFGRSTFPDTAVGESWELSAVPDSPSIVSSGDATGKTLESLFAASPRLLAGEAVNPQLPFPLLIKFLDAEDALSLQVHPDDDSALLFGKTPFGKSECWYIVAAGPDARICTGFNQLLTRPQLAAILAEGTLERYLSIISVREGELYHIPAGTVHAILGDVLIYEVQQSSDTTLRLFDWNRIDNTNRPRALHREQSVACADLTYRPTYRIDPIELVRGAYRYRVRIATRFFALEEYLFHSASTVVLPPKQSFRVLTALGYALQLSWGDGLSALLNDGSTVLIPAQLSPVSVSGVHGAKLLCTTVPELQGEIVEPLERAGIPDETIEPVGGLAGRNDLAEALAAQRINALKNVR